MPRDEKPCDELLSSRVNEDMACEQPNPSNTTHITTNLIPINNSSSSSSPTTTKKNFYVVRSSSTRRRLEQIMEDLQMSFNPGKRRTKCGVSFPDHMKYLRTNLSTSLSHALLAINLVEVQKSCPLDSALICLPAPEDIRALANDSKYGGPVEPVHKIDKKNTGSFVGSSLRTVITPCSRKVIGFVSSGAYSFARGRGSALGFCSFPAISELLLQCWLEKCRPLLLVRNTKSFQYRFATFRFV